MLLKEVQFGIEKRKKKKNVECKVDNDIIFLIHRFCSKLENFIKTK